MMSGSSTESLDGLRFKYNISNPHATIVKEGWLQKRGEHIKSWRPRYFVLRLDGSLVGYRQDPTQQEYTVVWNYFKVRDCQVINLDRRKPYTFRIIGFNFCSSIVRTFATETSDDRQEWVNALKLVVNCLNSLYGRNHPIDDIKNDTRAPEVQLSQQFSLLKAPTGLNDNGNYKATLENFDLLQILGQGSYDKVVLCREKSTNELYAIKMIRKDLIIKRDEVEHVLSENHVLRSTEHPFLVSLKYSFQTNDRLYYVTEFVCF